MSNVTIDDFLAFLQLQMRSIISLSTPNASSGLVNGGQLSATDFQSAADSVGQLSASYKPHHLSDPCYHHVPLQVILQIRRGGRLSPPHYSTPKLTEIMERCWQHIPEDRITFEAIVDILTDLNFNS